VLPLSLIGINVIPSLHKQYPTYYCSLNHHYHLHHTCWYVERVFICALMCASMNEKPPLSTATSFQQATPSVTLQAYQGYYRGLSRVLKIDYLRYSSGLLGGYQGY
jgi:hypothetical protein